MKQFELTVVRVSRSIIALVSFSLSVVGALYVYLHLDVLFWKITVSVGLILVINGLTIYSTFSKLTVNIIDNKLCFRWRKKYFFNFKPVEDIALEDIHTLVIERDEFEEKESLVKIITNRTKVNLGLVKYNRTDAAEFTRFLKENTDSKEKTSWDLWRDMGILKVVYVGNNIAMIVLTVVLIWIIANEDYDIFSGAKWIIFVCSYVGMIGHRTFLKSKMKTGSNKN